MKIEALFIGDGHLGSLLVTEGCSGSRHLGLEMVFMAQIQERSERAYYRLKQAESISRLV